MSKSLANGVDCRPEKNLPYRWKAKERKFSKMQEKEKERYRLNFMITLTIIESDVFSSPFLTSRLKKYSNMNEKNRTVNNGTPLNN